MANDKPTRLLLWILAAQWRKLAAVALLWKYLPVFLAMPFARALTKNPPHDGAGLCVPCHAQSYIKDHSHEYTVGTQSDYCRKCGLDAKLVDGKIVWPIKYCPNKVKKVNNPEKRRGWQDILSSVFWE
jgi:hypothetical protein